MWHPDVGVGCLLLLSASVFETESLTEPGTLGFSYDSWPTSLRDPPVFALSQGWGHRHMPLCLAFYVSAREQTQILTLVQQVLAD